MKFLSLKKALIAAAAFAVSASAGAAAPGFGKSGNLDNAGNNLSAVDLAVIQCLNNGKGNPARLVARLQDTSSPVLGLYVSLHLFKDGKMVTVTDQVAADNKWTALANLPAGAGFYALSVHKTDAGFRGYKIQYECRTAKNTPTGTKFIKWAQNQ